MTRTSLQWHVMRGPVRAAYETAPEEQAGDPWMLVFRSDDLPEDAPGPVIWVYSYPTAQELERPAELKDDPDGDAEYYIEYGVDAMIEYAVLGTGGDVTDSGIEYDFTHPGAYENLADAESAAHRHLLTYTADRVIFTWDGDVASLQC